MSLYKTKHKGFYQCLLLENTHRSLLSLTIIQSMEELNVEVFYANNLEKGINILHQQNIYLLILPIQLLQPLISNISITKNIKIIIILDTNNNEEFNYIMENFHLIPNNMEIIDYFFLPVDKTLFLHKIQFLINKEKQFVHLTEDNLEKYIWNTIHHQTKQLHNVIWKQNYNHYILTKYIQYLSFFFHILSLLNESQQDISTEYIIDTTINNIELQMCFFNCYIVFKINGKVPTHYNEKLKYFLLFLIFLAELMKINMINTEINLNFFNENGLEYVSIEMDNSLKSFVSRYNMMNATQYHLFHYLQEYLWEHWLKNVTLKDKSDNIIAVEVLLQNKKVKSNQENIIDEEK